MFELNLIKDKAKARQRRRVIFLSIVSIVLLSGLSLITVGSLYWSETTQLGKVNVNISSKQAEIARLQKEHADNDTKIRTRRNALIAAWLEDFDVIQNRPRLTPVVSDVARHYPRRGDFWYNQFSIRPIREQRVGSTPDRTQVSKDLMGNRQLDGAGYIEIEQSDVMTEKELQDMTAKMQDMVDLVGAPTFTIIDTSNDEGAAIAGGRYVQFTVTAAARSFSGGRTVASNR